MGRVIRAISLAALVAAAWLLAYACSDLISLDARSRGGLDFVQYWAGLRLLLLGQNPYDGNLMHLVQAQVGQLPDTTVLMWNPPWTPLLLAPVAALPFGAAIIAWALVNTACLCFVAAIGPSALGREKPPLLACGVAVVLFYPLADNVVLGQLSIFLTCIFTGTFVAANRGKLRLSGFLFALLTIKPHLFFLFVLPLLAWLCDLPRYRASAWISGWIGGCLLLLGITGAVAPESFAAWIASFGAPPAGPGAVPTVEWKTATISTVLRIVLSAGDGAAPRWPLWALPAAAAIVSGWFMFARCRPVNWPTITPPLLCLSLSLSPYGWLYDQSLLVLCQLAIVCDLWARPRDRRLHAAAAMLVAIQIGAILVAAQPGSAQHHFAWIPWAMLLAWWVGRPKISPAQSAP